MKARYSAKLDEYINKMKEEKESLNALYGKVVTQDIKYSFEDMCEMRFGGLTFEEVLKCVKEKYPENFI